VAALALAVLGAAATVLLTVSMQGVLARFALPALSLPFLIVYMCALSVGRALGAHWALPAACSVPELALLPLHLRAFFEALGAFLFTVRADAGLLVFAAFCVSSPRAALLAVLGYVISTGAAHTLHVPPGLSFAAALNATVSAVFLGMSSPSLGWRAYVRAAAGALLCLLITLGLAGPLGRLELSPLSLPFTLSIYAALLVERQRQLRTEQPLALSMTPRKAQG
jgi:urea transporter